MNCLKKFEYKESDHEGLYAVYDVNKKKILAEQLNKEDAELIATALNYFFSC